MKQSFNRLRNGYFALTIVLASAFAALWVFPAHAASPVPSPLPDSVLSIPLPAGTDTYEMVMAWDGKTLVVGTPWTDVEGRNAEGAVYIYSLDVALLDAGDPNPWSLDATIHMPEPQVGAQLGTAVAVEGDLIVAGAPGKDTVPFTASGVALFIERTAQNPEWHIAWVEKNEPRQVVDMNSVSMGNDANFGSSIAILDGRVMIGAPQADLIWEYQELPAVRHLKQGGVWIFERNPPEYLRPWDVTKTFLQNPIDPNTGFGASVAISRIDSLGITYYAIGAPGTNAMPYSYVGRVHTIWQQDGTPDNWNWGQVGRPTVWTDPSRFGNRIALDGPFLAVSNDHIGINDTVYVENLLVHLDYLFLESENLQFNYAFGSAFAMQNGVLVVGERGTPLHDFYAWGAIHYVERVGDEWAWSETLLPDGVSGGGVDELGNYLAGAPGGWFGDAIAMHSHWVLASAPFAGESGMIHILDRRPPPPAPEAKPLPWLVPDNIEPLNAAVGAPHTTAPDNILLPEGASARIFAPIVLQRSGGTSDFVPTPLPTQPAPTQPAPTQPAPTQVAPTQTPVGPNPSPTPPAPTSTPVTPAPTPTSTSTATSPGTTPTATASATASATAIPGTGRTQTLTNGGTIRSALGAGITAAQGATDESRVAYVLAVSQPVTPLVPFMQPLGNFYTVGVVTETLYSSVDAHFVVRLPVPAGADVANLGALVLLPEGVDHLHTENPGWIYAPGYYDSATQEFSFALTLLPRGGAVVVLVTGETLQTLGSAGADGAGAPPAAIYDVRCIGVAPSDPICDPSLAALVSSYFQQAHNRFQGFGFLPPNLQFAAPQVDSEGNPLPYNHLHYAASFIRKGPCAFAGQYHHATRTIDICLEAPALDPDSIGTINHELFHAVQFAYPSLLADKSARNNIGFLIEGTASVASRSTATELLHDLDWPQRNVDKALNAPFVLNDLTTYQTQDFWVYTGRALGVTMGYLHNIFNLGGEARDVDVALGNNLEGAYWEWIKNQVLTKEIDPDLRFFFYPCELDPLITTTETIYASEGVKYKKSVTLGPLTTKSYRIRIDGEIASDLQIWVDRAGAETRFIMYEFDGSNNCVSADDNTSLYFGGGVSDGVQVVVVVANANASSAEYYELNIQAVQGG